MFRDIIEMIEDALLNTLLFILLLAIICAPAYLCISVVTMRNDLEERTGQLEKAHRDISELQLKLMEAHNERDSAMHELFELKLSGK